jgi:hypothetical protein
MSILLDLPTPTYAGTTVWTKVTFTNPGSPRPVDPTTVTLTIFDALTTTVWTYKGAGSIVRLKQGVYLAGVVTDGSGSITWKVKWQGTGACAVVEVAEFPITEAPS